MGPISLRTCITSSFFRASLGVLLAHLEGDIGVDALALDLVGEAHHRGLGHAGWLTRALSTSAVPMR